MKRLIYIKPEAELIATSSCEMLAGSYEETPHSPRTDNWKTFKEDAKESAW